ncbi:MAG: hypothetical protein ACE5JG_06070 [Planctomycetota bacterium]
MKTIAALLLLPLVTLAEENAADLYHRAVWLEQAEGKPEEAEKLYRKVLADHAGAPEAPRALLGLIRIRSARGEDVKELTKLLEARYPEAKPQTERARRIAGAADRGSSSSTSS